MIDYSISPYATGTTDPYAAAEEERKRKEREAIAARMEAEAMANPVAPVEPTPIKETRTIDPTTGEVKLKIEGSERDLSAANANTPTYSGAAKPVAPDDTFNRMMQVESGGRQTDAQGRVLTSSKGALGVAQVMPTTAMQPGYGVPSIFDLAQKRGIPVQNRDLATAQQLLANRDLNQEFGANYYAAMKNRFDGGPGAVAAYNAGPGRVSQNMAQNQGQLNVAQLPQETQGYLQKVGMPAGPGPVSPQQVAQQPAQQPMPANQGIRIPGLTPLTQMPAPTPSLTTQAQQMFQQNQDNIDELMKMRNDPNAPEYLRRRSAERAYELMNSQYKTDQATAKFNELIASGDQNAIARVMTSKPRDEEGSWLKMIALGFLSPQLAGQEAIKLGLAPTKWEDTTLARDDGTEVGVQLQRRADGKILGGTYSDGTKLSAEDVAAAQTGSLGKGVHISKVESLIDPVTKQLVNRQTLSNGKEKYLAGGRPYQGDKSRLADAGEAVKQEDRRVNAAYNTLAKDIPNPTAQQKLAALRNAGVPDARIESELGMRVTSGITPAAPPTSYVNPSAPAPTPAATARKPQSPFLTLPGNEVFDPDNPPVVREGERKESGAARLKAWENKKKDYDHNVSQLYATKDSARTTVSDIDTLMNNANLSRITGIPGALPNIPGFAGADAQALLEKVNASAFIKGAQGMRGLGALSDKEGDAIRSSYAALNKSQSEESFRKNLVLYKEQIKRSQNLLDESLGQPPSFPDAMPVEKIRDAFNWLDKNANDPRASEVRKKLGLPK